MVNICACHICVDSIPKIYKLKQYDRNETTGFRHLDQLLITSDDLVANDPQPIKRKIIHYNAGK
jgi:hypothetical protein